VRADQSTVTGESQHVRTTSEAVLVGGPALTELPNLVFAGTSAAASTGKAVVVATGMDSEFGKIANLTQSLGDDLSPLQKEDDETVLLQVRQRILDGRIHRSAGRHHHHDCARFTKQCNEMLRCPVCLFGGLIFSNLPLRLEPVLNRVAFAAASLLIEFIGSLADLRCQIDRLFGQ
jgi:magnesium-transporting ATPase (P-type)